MKSKKVLMIVLSVTLGIGALVGYSVERARASGIPATQPMTYSGVLTDANGTPLTGSKNIQIQIYDMATAGNVQCTVGPTAIALVNGGFQLALPNTCTTAVHTSPDLWIEVYADGTSLGRTKLGAVPFAVESDHAKTADNATSATTAATATNATHATSADSATSATTATSAGHATSADSATSATNADNATNAGHAENSTYLNDTNHNYFETWDGVLHFWVDATNVKNFIISHPTDPDRYLVHTTLEGPENAVFYRGTARLHGGEAEVSLPAYFEAATLKEGRTVLLTPKFERADESVSALAASSVRQGWFVVRAIDGKNAEQAFDWEVKAVRADAPTLVPEPRREDIVVHGDGPYKYFTPKR